MDKTIGMHGSEFRQDYTWHPDWSNRNAAWWLAFGLENGKLYDYNRFSGGFVELPAAKFDGEPVPQYIGPYFAYNAYRWFSRRVSGRKRIIVPPWARLRLKSHTVGKPQFPGLNGAPWAGYR